jgi:hypothetical protein
MTNATAKHSKSVPLRHKNSKQIAEWLSASRTNRQSTREDIAAWWNFEMDAELWWQQTCVKCNHAAMILCGHNPIKTSENEAANRTTFDETSSSGTTPEDFRRLLTAFNQPEHTGSHRTLAYWLAVARARGLRYDHWIDEWMHAAGIEMPAKQVTAAFEPVIVAKVDETATATWTTESSPTQSAVPPHPVIQVFVFVEAAEAAMPATAIDAFESPPTPLAVPSPPVVAQAAESAKVIGASKPLAHQRHQESEILRVIGELGYDAKAFPKWTRGVSGEKNKVREALVKPGTRFTESIFKKAWDRLRKDGEIQDSPGGALPH